MKSPANIARPLALTMGEPAGIGPEITIGAWEATREKAGSFFAIADPALFARLGAAVAKITDPAETPNVFKSALPVMPLERAVHSTPGAAANKDAAAIVESIRTATSLALAGNAAGVVTNPIQKSSLKDAGFDFPGHTEFLGALTKDAPLSTGCERGAVMMIAGPSLKTVPVTIHQSVVEAAGALTSELIVKTGLITAQALQNEFGVASPRLAISGLNPHAGEAGALGAEDKNVIAPAIRSLQEMGVDAIGPLPADTMFHSEARSKYDVALCMLHDQALIPAKTLAFHEAVNVTLGLPIIRTSPDHGTALDIAGNNCARADSLIAAIRLAQQMAARRSARNL